MMKRYATGAVLGTTLVLSLAACGTDTKPQANANLSANQVLVSAVEKTGQVETFGADLTVDGNIKVHGSGQFRIKPNTAFNVNLDKVGLGGTSFAGTGGTQVVFLDNALYVRNSQLSQLLKGKPWMKITVAEAAAKAGFNADELIKNVQQANPADLAKIMAASTDVKKVGEEKVDGVQTTHFQGTISAKDAIAKYDPELKKKVDAMGHKGDGTIAFDLWSDGESLPRKVVIKFNAGDDNASATVLFRDYGKKVSVGAPPAEETGPLNIPNFSGS